MNRPVIQSVDLWYPRSNSGGRLDDQPQAIRVGLMDVRSADSLLIEYDFERDGYKISMPTKHQWEPNEPIDEQWAEVAFVSAWATAGKGDCNCPDCEEERANNENREEHDDRK